MSAEHSKFIERIAKRFYKQNGSAEFPPDTFETYSQGPKDRARLFMLLSFDRGRGKSHVSAQHISKDGQLVESASFKKKRYHLGSVVNTKVKR